jgi:hypothetical protein
MKLTIHDERIDIGEIPPSTDCHCSCYHKPSSRYFPVVIGHRRTQAVLFLKCYLG